MWQKPFRSPRAGSSPGYPIRRPSRTPSETINVIATIAQPIWIRRRFSRFSYSSRYWRFRLVASTCDTPGPDRTTDGSLGAGPGHRATMVMETAIKVRTIIILISKEVGCLLGLDVRNHDGQADWRTDHFGVCSTHPGDESFSIARAAFFPTRQKLSVEPKPTDQPGSKHDGGDSEL